MTDVHGFTHNVENTNTSAAAIPGLIGSKTGFTDLAGGNLAVVFDVGLSRPVIAVVLGSTKETRFTDIEQLVNATFTHFETLPVMPQGTTTPAV